MPLLTSRYKLHLSTGKVSKQSLGNQNNYGRERGWYAYPVRSWWRHQMETFSAILAICAGNSPVPGEFPTQRPVTRSFDVYFDLRPNKRLSKQSLGWWFETLSPPLWRHRNVMKWGVVCKKQVSSAETRNSISPWWRHQMETFSA